MQSFEVLDLLARLRDPGLLRTQAYIGGKWQSARDGAQFPVIDPATGKVLSHVPAMGARGDPRGDRLRRGLSRGVELTPGQGSRPGPAPLVRPVIGEPRRYRDAHDRGAGQAPRRGQRRGRLHRGLSRLVRRRGPRPYGDMIPSHSQDARILVLNQPVGVMRRSPRGISPPP